MAQTDPTKKKKAAASSSKTDPKKGKTTTRTSGTTTKTKTKKPAGGGYTSTVRKAVKVQKGVTDGKTGQSGSYMFYKDPSEKGFNAKKDREFVSRSGMRLAKNAGAIPSKKK